MTTTGKSFDLHWVHVESHADKSLRGFAILFRTSIYQVLLIAHGSLCSYYLGLAPAYDGNKNQIHHHRT